LTSELQLGAAEIRRAVDGDLDAVVDLIWHVAAEGEWIGAEVPFDRDDRRQRYAELLAAPRSALFVADATSGGGPTVVGEISVSVAPYGVADIAMMLAKGWRGQGLGRALLDTAIAWAESTGAHKMWLEVWPHNTPAIALYRRAGFVEEGRKRRHYRRRNGELWDALLMGLPLPRDEDRCR
jgi:RimJ/RimL family protein N-acetyltransferase